MAHHSVLSCDVPGCTVRQTVDLGMQLHPRWMLRIVQDRLLTVEGKVSGAETQYHFCPEHAQRLEGVDPRVKAELDAMRDGAPNTSRSSEN